METQRYPVNEYSGGIDNVASMFDDEGQHYSGKCTEGRDYKVVLTLLARCYQRLTYVIFLQGLLIGCFLVGLIKRF